MTTLSIIILFASSVAGSVFLGILLDVWFYTRKKDRIKIMGKWLKENKKLGTTTIHQDDYPMSFEEIADAISVEENKRISVQAIHGDFLSAGFKYLAYCLGTGIEPEDLAPIWRGSV